MLVRKKDGGLCFCIDFCKVEHKDKKDSYPLPCIQEAIESLVGAGYFSCLDLKAGFWQIAMDEASKQYTAFTVGNLGFFECEWMPSGLCNAPATFQRLMQNCLGKWNLTVLFNLLGWCDCPLQNWGRAFAWCLHVVFKCFWEHNLKLKPSKCEFFCNEINYLAHHVSKEGISAKQGESESCGWISPNLRSTPKSEPV